MSPDLRQAVAIGPPVLLVGGAEEDIPGGIVPAGPGQGKGLQLQGNQALLGVPGPLQVRAGARCQGDGPVHRLLQPGGMGMVSRLPIGVVGKGAEPRRLGQHLIQVQDGVRGLLQLQDSTLDITVIGEGVLKEPDHGAKQDQYRNKDELESGLRQRRLPSPLVHEPACPTGGTVYPSPASIRTWSQAYQASIPSPLRAETCSTSMSGLTRRA